MPSDWSRAEVEVTVADYFAMLAAELSGVPVNKAAHRKRLLPRLNGRSEQAVEFKHSNISAALVDLGFPYITGYKPRANYQRLLYEVVAERLASDKKIQEIAAADVDQPISVPEVDDILSVLTDPPKTGPPAQNVNQLRSVRSPSTNYLAREAHNRSLGLAGEEFVLNFERARLISEGSELLAGRIEHTSRVRGDGEGYDILSFDKSGRERLVEVKTTKYGIDTPFFVSSNEVRFSATRPENYYLYRLFTFRTAPRLFTVKGSFEKTCWLSAASYLAGIR